MRRKSQIICFVSIFTYINGYLIMFAFLQSFCDKEHRNVELGKSSYVSPSCGVRVYPLIIAAYFGINDCIQYAFSRYMISSAVKHLGCSRFLPSLVPFGSPLVFCWCLRYDVIPTFSNGITGIANFILFFLAFVCVIPYLRNLSKLVVFYKEFFMKNLSRSETLDMLGRSTALSSSLKAVVSLVWILVAVFYGFLLFDLLYLVTAKTPINMFDSSVIDIGYFPLMSMFCYFALSIPHKCSTIVYTVTDRNNLQLEMIRSTCFDGSLCLFHSLVTVMPAPANQAIPPANQANSQSITVSDYSNLPLWARKKLTSDSDVSPA